MPKNLFDQVERNSSSVEIDMTEGLSRVKFASAKLTDNEQILSNLLQIQHQYRIFHFQTKSLEQSNELDSAYSSLDFRLEDLIESFVLKYGGTIQSEELEFEVFNYQNSASCRSITDSYVGFLTRSLPLMLKAGDDNLLCKVDGIITNLISLKH